MNQEKIDRINQLAKKAKESSLTPEEAAEQKALRAEFVRDFRGNLETQLEDVRVEMPDGTLEKLEKIPPKEKE